MDGKLKRLPQKIAYAGIWTGLGFLVLPRILAQLAKAQGERKGYTMKQFKLRARDGTRLSAALYLPLDPPQSNEGYPAIIMVHSWMLSRWQCHLYAPYFASDGYVVLAYDCRGWGSSRGQVQCAAPDKEINDLIDAIDYLETQEEAPVNPQRIGVTGISYGGGHSFLISVRDSRVRAVAPMHGWTDLEYSLTPNGSLKLIWGLLLLITASWATKLNFRNILYRWTATLLLGRGDPEEFRQEMKDRSVIHQVEEVSCPTFIVGSWNDDLFEPNQMLDYYQRLKAPRKLYIGRQVHGMDAGLGPRLWGKELWAYTKDWFDYWLKDLKDSKAADSPRVHIYKPWLGKTVDYRDWPPEGLITTTYFLQGGDDQEKRKLLGNPPDRDNSSPAIINRYLSRATSGPSVLRLPSLGIPIPGPQRDYPGETLSFTTPPFQQDLEILGAPSLSLYVQPDRESCQLNALLYDLSERGSSRLITYGTWTGRGLEPDRENQVEFQLFATAYLLRKGHRLRLTFTASDPLFVLPLRERFAVELTHRPGLPQVLSLPTMKPRP